MWTLVFLNVTRWLPKQGISPTVTRLIHESVSGPRWGRISWRCYHHCWYNFKQKRYIVNSIQIQLFHCQGKILNKFLAHCFVIEKVLYWLKPSRKFYNISAQLGPNNINNLLIGLVLREKEGRNKKSPNYVFIYNTLSQFLACTAPIIKHRGTSKKI